MSQSPDNPVMLNRVITSDMIDEELMKRYLNGDSAAFAEIYNRYKSKIYAYLLKRTNNKHESDDLIQAVFLKFHQCRHKYNSEYPLLQWLYVITRSTFIDFYRKDRSYLHDELTGDEVGEFYEKNTIDIKIIQSLPSNDQVIVRSRIIDEASYQEIALKLNKSEPAIRKIFSRAMQKLKKQLLLEEKNEIT